MNTENQAGLEQDQMSIDHVVSPTNEAGAEAFEYADIIDVGDVKIPFSSHIISKGMEKRLRRNRYEGGETDKSVIAVRQEDRVIELGAGIGYLSSFVCKTSKPAQYVAIEANPDLIPVIKEAHRLNEIQNIQVLNGILSGGPESSFDFYLRSDFWASSMEPDSRPYVRVEKVPKISASDLFKSVKPTVLLIDIEGAEAELLKDLDLSTVREIVIELHAKVYGPNGIGKILRLLSDRGFLPTPEARDTTVRHFRRIATKSAVKRPPAKMDLTTLYDSPADYPVDPKSPPRVMVATCMKDEGPFIMEWVAWNKAIGIRDIVVFTNNCSDGSDLLLDRLHEMGEIIHLPNPAVIANPPAFQPFALRYAQLMPEFRKADYFLSIDVDEFLNIRVGDGTISALIMAAGAFDALSISELNHGCNLRKSFEPGWVMDQFPGHQTEYPRPRKAHRGVKTLTKISGKLLSVRNHRPDFVSDRKNPVIWRDGSGIPTTHFSDERTTNGIDCRGRYNLASLDHYALRSLDDYLAKMYRGDVVRKNYRVSPRYWRLRNGNSDFSSQLLRARKAAEKKYMAMMADPELERLHDVCCERYNAAIERTRGDTAFVERRNLILEKNWSS